MTWKVVDTLNGRHFLLPPAKWLTVLEGLVDKKLFQGSRQYNLTIATNGRSPLEKNKYADYLAVLKMYVSTTIREAGVDHLVVNQLVLSMLTTSRIDLST